MQKKSFLAGVGVLILGLLLVFATRKAPAGNEAVTDQADDSVVTTPTTKPATVTDQVATSVTITAGDKPKTDTASTSNYTDGTYTATGAYTAPSGAEEIGVALTLKNGVITAVTVTPVSANPVSSKFQTTVASNISVIVVGKSIDELNVTNVSGSSLTPVGFNDAIAKIKAEAKA